eukprot:XP_001700021.1 predicted protein [Chlamydomonas reinhardtii]
MGATQSSADGVVTVVAAPGQTPSGGLSDGPHDVALLELQAHVARLGEQLQAIKLQGEGPTAWAFTSGGVTSTLPAIGGSPGPKRSQAAPSSGATSTGNAARGASSTSGRAGSSSGNLGGGGARAAQDWLMLGLGLGGSAGAGPTRHTAATAAAAELQAAATEYRRWYAENEAAAARRQAALHSRMGQVAAEARDTVAVLGRVTEANNPAERLPADGIKQVPIALLVQSGPWMMWQAV